MWASKILGLNLKERITGIGLLESLCQAAAKQPITVGFLGGGEGVAVKAAECLQAKYPGLKVGFAGERWDVGREMRDRVGKNSFSSSHPNSLLTSHPHIDILFVAFGAPKQEFWISENLDKIPVKVAIGVGGAFDFISGSVPRATKFLRLIGLEWLFRLILQPWRWKRQLALLQFLWLVIKQKLAIYYLI